MDIICQPVGCGKIYRNRKCFGNQRLPKPTTRKTILNCFARKIFKKVGNVWKLIRDYLNNWVLKSIDKYTPIWYFIYVVRYPDGVYKAKNNKTKTIAIMLQNFKN